VIICRVQLFWTFYFLFFLWHVIKILQVLLLTKSWVQAGLWPAVDSSFKIKDVAHIQEQHIK
jgi:hypothetical protein